MKLPYSSNSSAVLGEEHYRRLQLEGAWGEKPDPAKCRILDQYACGSRVLDVGCAVGHYVDYLAGKDQQAFGLDFTRDFFPDIQKSGKRGMYACATAQALPFAAKSFDTTILFDILEHLPDDLQVLKEVIRVTRSTVIVRVPLSEPAQMDMTGLIFYHHMDRSHLRTYTLETLRGQLQSAGLVVEKLIPDCPADIAKLLLKCAPLPAPRGSMRILRGLLRVFRFKQLYTDCYAIARVE